MPISLAIIDLDYFKLLNDTYGHQAGDECLKPVAIVLKRFCKRPSDICARYGGEEFVMLYADTSLEQEIPLINNLHNEITSLNIPNKNSPTPPTLTASIGLTTMYPYKKNNMNNLIKIADESLYLAKEMVETTFLSAQAIKHYSRL